MIPQLHKMRSQLLCHIDRMGDISMLFLKSLTQGCLYPSGVNHWFGMTNTSEAISISSSIYLQQLQRGLICLKKSLPLSSTRMNAGKSSTSIFQIASMPSSGYSTHSMLLMLF